jgi:hypothetical protein
MHYNKINGTETYPFKPSLEEYLAKRPYNVEKLLNEAKTAIAWGIPDRESIGYSREKLIDIIGKLIKHIERN